MGITKKFLQSMEIPDNKIELIFDEYANAIAGITADRDKYKEQADKLASVEKELVKAQAKAEELETVSEQLKKVRAEYADYKAGVDPKRLLIKSSRLQTFQVWKLMIKTTSKTKPK